MNRTIVHRIGWALALVALVSSDGAAQTPGIRDVSVTDRSLVTINAKVRWTTLIVLPDGENIMEVTCGDQDFWQIAWSNNIAHVKPSKETGQTNLHLLATSGTIYSFVLVAGPGQPDLKVFVAGDHLQAGQKPKYYAAEHVAALESEVAQATAATEAAQQIARKAIDEVKETAPLDMTFPYDQVPYKPPFLIRSIWSDGRFTYIRTDAQELPVIYELKDGQPALVNFNVPKAGTYVVPKVLASGYFSMGKERQPFKARGGNGD